MLESVPLTMIRVISFFNKAEYSCTSIVSDRHDKLMKHKHSASLLPPAQAFLGLSVSGGKSQAVHTGMARQNVARVLHLAHLLIIRGKHQTSLPVDVLVVILHNCVVFSLELQG